MDRNGKGAARRWSADRRQGFVAPLAMLVVAIAVLLGVGSGASASASGSPRQHCDGSICPDPSIPEDILTTTTVPTTTTRPTTTTTRPTTTTTAPTTTTTAPTTTTTAPTTTTTAPTTTTTAPTTTTATTAPRRPPTSTVTFPPPTTLLPTTLPSTTLPSTTTSTLVTTTTTTIVRVETDESPLLELASPSAVPGGTAVLAVEGCRPGEDVTFDFDGEEVATGTAGDDGSLSQQVSLPVGDIGRHTVTATCGDRTVETPIDIVSTSTAGASSTSGGVVLAFFLLIGLLLTQGRGAVDAPEQV